jgi:hypothetical protein
MLMHLATARVRRLPALLLLPCLLAMGLVVVRAPVEDDGADGMRAYGTTHAQVVRAPQLVGLAPVGPSPVAVLHAAVAPPLERFADEAVGHGPPLVGPRTIQAPPTQSRAPPTLA